MSRASREAAEDLLTDARNLLQRNHPGLVIEAAVLEGDPNKELMRAASEAGARTIFIGRGTPGARPRETISGIVEGWNRNHEGRFDGLVLGWLAQRLLAHNSKNSSRACIHVITIVGNKI